MTGPASVPSHDHSDDTFETELADTLHELAHTPEPPQVDPTRIHRRARRRALVTGGSLAAVLVVGGGGTALALTTALPSTRTAPVAASPRPAHSSPAPASSRSATAPDLPKPVVVPDLNGLTQPQAIAILKGLGLTAAFRETTTTQGVPGTVTAVQPAPGSTLTPGSEVNLTISP